MDNEKQEVTSSRSLPRLVRCPCGMEAKGVRGAKRIEGVTYRYAKCPKCGRENLLGKLDGWEGWSKSALAREIQARMTHFYGRTDGTMEFPPSAEGDILKMVYVFLSSNVKRSEPGENLNET